MAKPNTGGLKGTDGDDILTGTGGNDTIYGYAGADVIHGLGGADQIYGGDGIDDLYGDDGDDFIDGGTGNDTVHGGAGNDTVSGMEGDDYVYGDAGNDRVIGATGDDHLYGGDGDDVIVGEWGADQMWGGSGADVFQYDYGADSTTRTDWYPPDLDPSITYGVDIIWDFESGIDKIDLSRLDADLTTPVLSPKGKSGQPTGEDAFTIVSQTDGVTPGHLTVTYDSETGFTTINGYMDTVAGADITLTVFGPVAASDFVL